MKRILNHVLMAVTALAVIGCGGAAVDRSASPQVDVVFLQEGDLHIEGTVFSDINSNGVWNTGEPGIGGVTVQLEGLDTTVTNAEGQYAFSVSAGNYTVVETDPAGYTSTTPNSVDVEVVDEDVYVNFGDHSEMTEPVFDVKPGSTLNPVNLKSNGVLPVAILGSDVLDVTEIDPASILLNGVAPLRWSIEDVCGPDPDPVDGWADDDIQTPDGYHDLTLKFSTQEIAATLGPVVRGDVVVVVLEGEMLDGTPIMAEELIFIVQVPK